MKQTKGEFVSAACSVESDQRRHCVRYVAVIFVREYQIRQILRVEFISAEEADAGNPRLTKSCKGYPRDNKASKTSSGVRGSHKWWRS